MTKKSKKGKRSTKAGSGGQSWLEVDPARVRYQHSRIRPYFSGCGRSVPETLEEIRNKKLSPSDLPPIQVIVGPEDESGPWYFSLNNRRLWVLKQCREEGLLENNLIRVRVRQPKSGSEEERYTLENCAVEAKFIREKDPQRNAASESNATVYREPSEEGGTKSSQQCRDNSSSISDGNGNAQTSKELIVERLNEQPDEDSISESDDSSDEGATTNRFSALM